jgi:ABC-2 type transport system permease protein
MKLLDIALKDMTRSFRSYFALMFMFGVPLLMGGMFYLMYSGRGNESGFSIPATKVAVANLDAGSPGFDAVRAQFPAGTDAGSLGEWLLAALQSERFAGLLTVTAADSADAARALVDSQKAGVAVILPPDFSERFADPSGRATIELYSDPTLTLGPAVVQSILAQFMDGLSGAKIAAGVVAARAGSEDPALIGPAVQQYAAGAAADGAGPLLDARAPSAVKAAEADPVSTVVGLIMAGMAVFYAFFTGTSTAQSILREEEEGTLARLFTTPTEFWTVLGGKLLSVGLTVSVQMAVLLLVSGALFGIRWGSPLSAALMTLGTVAAASGFGVCLMSLMKSARQASIVIGSVVTATGMLGMAQVFGMGSPSAATMNAVSLIVPQGWGIRGLMQAMNGAAAAELLPTLAALLLIGAALFVVGVIRFQKRFA